MSVKIASDFTYKIKGAHSFSALQSDWLFIENSEFPKKEEKEPPLSFDRHCEFVQRVIHAEQCKCLWLVETASDSAMTLLQKRFANHERRKCSIAGYFDPDLDAIRNFWGVFAELYKKEPWNHEQPWVMAGVRDKMSSPPVWTLEHLFGNQQNLHSIFVQEGWFAYFGARNVGSAVDLIRREFPALF